MLDSPKFKISNEQAENLTSNERGLSPDDLQQRGEEEDKFSQSPVKNTTRISRKKKFREVNLKIIYMTYKFLHRLCFFSDKLSYFICFINLFLTNRYQ